MGYSFIFVNPMENILYLLVLFPQLVSIFYFMAFQIMFRNLLKEWLLCFVIAPTFKMLRENEARQEAIGVEEPVKYLVKEKFWSH